MVAFFMALVVSALGVVPLLIWKKGLAAAITAAASALVLWPIIYAAKPTLVWPLFGLLGVLVVVWWCGVAIAHVAMVSDSYNREGVNHLIWIIAVLGVGALLGRGCAGCGAIRSSEYAGLIGPVDERVWTQDVQPKDPKHVRLVPREMASWLADKQLGEAPGAIGSQFQVSHEHMTLQMIKGELWYVAPLEFRDFSSWTASDVSPGYVMVHGEDPLRPVVVKTDEKFAYMPGAYFSHDLERHLQYAGYLTKGLADFSFEIDEDGHPWWVVTVFEPTIAWWGEKVLGIVIADPTGGTNQFYELGKAPKWVDRVMPGEFVENYVDSRGAYSRGWINSWWGKKDLTMAGKPTVIYGSDGDPWWVCDVTSSNQSDESLVGLMYVDSRTGKAVYYRAVGGTEEAVLKAVDNKVSYRKWHGASPVLYNIYGTMASIVPLLGENHTFQGVAVVRVDNLQVAIGDSAEAAFREYQRLISQNGQEIAPELAHNLRTLVGQVDRVATEIREKGTLYYLHLAGVKRLFTGGGELSPKLPLTRPGDTVEIEFIDSGESVEPLNKFDNRSLPLDKAPVQAAAERAAAERRDQTRAHRNARDLREKLKKMSDEELERQYGGDGGQ